MNKSDIDQQFKSGRLKLSTGEALEHFAFIIPILFISYAISVEELDAIGYSRKIPIGILISLAAIGFYLFHQYSVLKFKKYRFEHASEHFKEAAKATAIEQNWRIEKLDDVCLMARKQDIMLSWDGMRITIIRKENTIFENSIMEPSIRSHPFSFGRNARNLDHFNKNLIQAAEGKYVISTAEINVKEVADKFENEPEWNLKNTVKRVIVYVIILVLLIVCALSLRESFSPVVIPVLMICLGYLIMDIAILLRKGRKNGITQ